MVTAEMERGDDRDREVMAERLQELFDQPAAPEPNYEAKNSDIGPGDIVVSPLAVRGYPQRLGHLSLRRAHIR